eukprot:CAMPEP_0181051478 /NCGR_PEP_ID=MMETSP1070-20121207/17079_1 /TAXON_ID=265543 /ORGANISM="Minutocellus polymorphus, Strain NH13" /LENGTH=245 /DNA_ID=CAMNT_0023130509 /DNA_START=60 /DNA_END=794 /DNA_ORIENTATION=-
MKRFLVVSKGAAAKKRAKSSAGVAHAQLPQPRKISHHDDLDVLYYPRFIDDGSISPALSSLPLEETSIVMFGKTVKEPRRTGYFSSSNERPLQYSGSVRHPLPLTAELELIRKKIEELPDVKMALAMCGSASSLSRNGLLKKNKNDDVQETTVEEQEGGKKSSASRYSFTGCFANMYLDGSHYMGFHSDDEVENGPSKDNRVIASVTFGEGRRFVFKRKSDGTKVELTLAPGSLLLMKGRTQSIW